MSGSSSAVLRNFLLIYTSLKSMFEMSFLVFSLRASLQYVRSQKLAKVQSLKKSVVMSSTVSTVFAHKRVKSMPKATTSRQHFEQGLITLQNSIRRNWFTCYVIGQYAVTPVHQRIALLNCSSLINRLACRCFNPWCSNCSIIIIKQHVIHITVQ